MRELLIRYLLGELDHREQQDLERRLAESSELRRELARLRSCFTSSCQADEPVTEPPRDLAKRTTARIAGDAGEPAEFLVEPARRQCLDVDPPAGLLGWSLADLTVAGGVVLAVSMLLFPALGDSRNATRRTVCQNNQYQLWVLATKYANDHGRYYPRVEPHENAGMFAFRLAEKGYIAREDLAVLLVCPGAPLADAIRSGQLVMRVPSSIELRSMSQRELAEARRNMSPFYAFRFPYRVGQEYHYIRDERLPLSPLFSDTSGAKQDGLMSPNHGGSIVQVTCQDGSVRSLTTCTVPGRDDKLFLNAMGLMEAGLGQHDAVLGRSDARPAMHVTSSSR